MTKNFKTFFYIYMGLTASISVQHIYYKHELQHKLY